MNIFFLWFVFSFNFFKDCFIQNIISQQFDLLLQQQHEFEPFFFQNSHYQNEKFATNNFEQNDEFCNENSSEDDDDDDKNENETLSLQSSLSGIKYKC